MLEVVLTDFVVYIDVSCVFMYKMLFIGFLLCYSLAFIYAVSYYQFNYCFNCSVQKQHCSRHVNGWLVNNVHHCMGSRTIWCIL